MNLLLNKRDYSLSSRAVVTAIALDINFILNSFQSTSEVSRFECIEDSELTKMCTALSEDSFKEAWANEDDAKWQAFLNE